MTFKHGITGVFLDPPYADEAQRTDDLYASDSGNVAHAVREWAIANGDNPKLRIALCGYQGEHAMPESMGPHRMEGARRLWITGNRIRQRERGPRTHLVQPALLRADDALFSATSGPSRADARRGANKGGPRMIRPCWICSQPHCGAGIVSVQRPRVGAEPQPMIHAACANSQQVDCGHREPDLMPIYRRIMARRATSRETAKEPHLAKKAG